MSSDAVTLFLGLLVGGLGMLTVILLVLFLVGSFWQYTERERRYERERERNQPAVIVIQAQPQAQQPQRLQPPPNVVMCDPQNAYIDSGFGYPAGTWQWDEPQRRIEVRR